MRVLETDFPVACEEVYKLNRTFFVTDCALGESKIAESHNKYCLLLCLRLINALKILKLSSFVFLSFVFHFFRNFA